MISGESLDSTPPFPDGNRSPALRFLSLGGIGEIGMNCYILEYNGHSIMIDCGQMQPESEMLGIDLVIPDFSYLFERKDQLRGIILTHGHEDHTGALPYLLSRITAPIYGTGLTLGFVKVKLKENKMLEEARLIEIIPGEGFEIAPFRIVPYRVTHSLADSVGYVIETPAGNVVFSGDYKLETDPRPGDYFDYKTLSSYGERGVLALFADSTNVERPGTTPSESKVTDTLDRIFRKADRTLVISTFASSIHRIQNILDLASKYDRYVFLSGLNMVRNIRMAREMGYLDISEERIRDLRELEETPPERRLLLSTGSQGEPLSVMSRLALDRFKWLNLEKGDTVIISARVIPGNEKAILQLINHLSRRGTEVYYEWTEHVHSSGHAYREDMKHLIQLTRPRYLVPIHGEYRHLNAHKKLAMELGMEEESIFIQENGMVLEFNGEGARRAGDVEASRVLIDGNMVGDTGNVVLRDRHHLSRDGMLVIILAIDSHSGTIVSGPDILTRGFVFADENEDLLNRAKDLVLEVFDTFDPESREDWGVMKESVRRALKKFLKNETARFPMILPVIIEI